MPALSSNDPEVAFKRAVGSGKYGGMRPVDLTVQELAEAVHCTPAADDRRLIWRELNRRRARRARGRSTRRWQQPVAA